MLTGLHTASELLNSKYGAVGTESRAEFDAKAWAYYYGVVLRGRRKEFKMTQRELAEKSVPLQKVTLHDSPACCLQGIDELINEHNKVNGKN